MKYATTESGLIVPEYIIRKPKRKIAFDFFAGAGGFSLGFIQGGFEIVGANEFNAAAAMTYMVNLGHYPIQIHCIEGEKDKNRLDKAIRDNWGIKENDEKKKSGYVYSSTHCAGSGWISHHTEFEGVKDFWFGNVRKLKGKDILDTLGLKQGDIDVVMGGPPCQGFSRIGHMEVGDARNNLVYEYARMIVELQPKTFIMEEVPDILNFYDPDGVPVLDKFCKILEDGDFGTWDLIKKSLLTQMGSAAIIKDNLKKHRKKKSSKKENEYTKEQNLFEEEC